MNAQSETETVVDGLPGAIRLIIISLALGSSLATAIVFGYWSIALAALLFVVMKALDTWRQHRPSRVLEGLMLASWSHAVGLTALVFGKRYQQIEMLGNSSRVTLINISLGIALILLFWSSYYSAKKEKTSEAPQAAECTGDDAKQSGQEPA